MRFLANLSIDSFDTQPVPFAIVDEDEVGLVRSQRQIGELILREDHFRSPVLCRDKRQSRSSTPSGRQQRCTHLDVEHIVDVLLYQAD